METGSMLEDKIGKLRGRAAAIQSQLAAIHSELAEIDSEIERLIVFDDAVSMAYTERTGLELRPGEPYTAKDAERADEILALYPWSES
jgi:hypothetical protein